MDGRDWDTRAVEICPLAVAIRCYNHQQQAYKARCANVGHHHSNYPRTFAKCAACDGPHLSFSRNCPKRWPPQ
ncbi:hypothetical protein F5Y09DRAFT_317937 [Xylaria sp. FL1042]|nr:hypothetical protein F5Y09DRAFT_317937 [Xylaria sp. FL1042]